MNILLFDVGSYMYNDILECLKGMGHAVSTVYYSFENRIKDDFFETRFREKIKEREVDVVFSVNFFPLVAKAAQEFGIPYISWNYDSPLSSDLESFFEFDTNYIFLFDREEVKKYRLLGYSRVFHNPLAVNTKRLENLSFIAADRERFIADISFVGQLYDQPILSTFMTSMDDYSRGYIDALINTQISVYGADLISGTIDDIFMEKVNTSRKRNGLSNELTSKSLIFAIQKQISFAERVTLVSIFGEYFHTKYYNTSNYDFGSNVEFMGPVKYMTEMPAVFRFSKLNLCPTVRSILSGIPLRALDILGSGGTLFSNYQPELAENFEDGIDVIMYGSLEEAFDKAKYYLEHEADRNEIAKKGHERVKRQFNFENRLKEMLENVL